LRDESEYSVGLGSVAWKKIGEWRGIGVKGQTLYQIMTREKGKVGIKRHEGPFENVTIY